MIHYSLYAVFKWTAQYGPSDQTRNNLYIVQIIINSKSIKFRAKIETNKKRYNFDILKKMLYNEH